jgi:hypothetical protein
MKLTNLWLLSALLMVLVGCNNSKDDDKKVKLTPAIEPIELSLSQSSASISSSSLVSGETALLTIELKDIDGNPFVDAASLESEIIVGQSTASISSFNSLGGGIYTAEVIAKRAGTTSSIAISVNSLALESTLPQLSVSAGPINHVKIETLPDGSGSVAGLLNLNNGQKQLVYLVARDLEGNFISNVSALSWSTNTNNVAVLSNAQGPSTNIIPNFNAGGVVLTAVHKHGAQYFNATSTIITSYTVTDLDLIHWYKADSFQNLIANNSAVNLVWRDLSLEATKYDAPLSSTNQRPVMLESAVDSRPGLLFCNLNVAGGCLDATSDRVRIANSITDSGMSQTDFTVIVVSARGNGNANHIISSSNSSAGLFMGWTNGVNFKFGVNGSAGANAISATVPAYTENKYEIWTAKLDREVGSSNPGLRLYRNGQLVASNAGFSGSIAASTHIPYIGVVNSKMFVGEVLIYNRALSTEELDEIHGYLTTKFL